MNKLKWLLIVSAFIILDIKATHIIGGDFSYQCLGKSNQPNSKIFEFTFDLYKDDFSNIVLANNQTFGVYKKNSQESKWEWIRSIRTPIMDSRMITVMDSCIIDPPLVRIEVVKFKFQAILEENIYAYQIVFMQCCRNVTVRNLQNPIETGSALYVQLFGQAISSCNNSPQFNNQPPPLVCVNKDFYYDVSMLDAEGDSLVYKLCSPLKVGGTDGGITPGNPFSCTGVTSKPEQCLPPYEPVSYTSNYSYLKPIDGIYSFDASLGRLHFNSNVSGQFVVGICIEEYRKGQLMSQLHRDFQLTVAHCQYVTTYDEKTFCSGSKQAVYNDIVYTEDGTYEQYFITAEGCDSIAKIKIVFKDCITYSNIFTPNNDGLNDYFILMPSDQITKIIDFGIYDRWGNLVFHQNRFNVEETALTIQWDGRKNGKLLADGIYVFKIVCSDFENNTLVKYGDVTLLK